MPLEITVPRLGWSMEEGVFVNWLKAEGEFVRAGEPLFTIEADKAVQEIESIDSGLLRIAEKGPKPGGAIRVGDLLGYLLAESESDLLTSAPSKTALEVIESAWDALAAPEPRDEEKTPPAMRQATPAISPRALRLARELGVDWITVAGTGRTGRIRERDIRAAAETRAVRTVSETHEPAASPAAGRCPPRAVFFGEIILRMTAPRHERLAQAREFGVSYAGPEANAAVALAGLGLGATFVSAVPDTELGRACLQHLRRYGVDADRVARLGGRIGTCYVETGAPPRSSKTIPDRAGSAFSELKPELFDWAAILSSHQWFHWSGPTAGLGAGIPQIIADACATAKRLGLGVSCDLHDEGEGWGKTQARAALPHLLGNVDVLIGSDRDFSLLANSGSVSGFKGSSRTEDRARQAAFLRERFNVSAVAVTPERWNDPADMPTACLLANAEAVFASRPRLGAAVDHSGVPDAFSGALICALLTGLAGSEAVEFAAAAASLKGSISGNLNFVTREEVLAVTREAGGAGAMH